MQLSESASERLTDETAEMHHRFSNTLQMVRSLLSHEARRDAGTTCADVLGKAEAQILAFTLLHEQLRETRRSEGHDDVCAGTYLVRSAAT